MFCAKCGNEIKGSETVCSRCGAAVNTPLQKEKSEAAAEGPRKKCPVPAVIAALVLVVIAALVCHFNSKPYLYASAVSYLEEGDYVRAEKTFSRIADYEDSEVLLAVCQYQHARKCTDNGDYDQALELIRAYEASSANMSVPEEEIALCKEEIAVGYNSQERYEEAACLYRELGKLWKEAETYAVMGNYSQAIELTQTYDCDKEQGKTREQWYRAQVMLCTGESRYDEAWEYLRDYKGDYNNELYQCAYQIACAFADSRKYEDAVKIAEMLKNNMEEAGQLLNDCYEAWGIAYVGEEDYESAWGCFSKCIVTEAGRPGLYATGKYYMDQGLYQDAHAIWDVLKDYQDSVEQLAECCRRQGKALEQAGEYSSAVAMYEECGDTDLIKRCIYHWAADAYEQGEYEFAIQKYAELGDYEDSAEMISKCRYAWGWSAYRQGDYEPALQIFTELGNYKDSVEMTEEVQETIRQKAIEDEKRARRGVLEGTWRTESGDIRIQVSVTHENVLGGGKLSFLMPTTYHSVNTIAGTLSGMTLDCHLSTSTFAGADNQTTDTGGIVDRTYHWDSWDYQDGTLYLHAAGGGWSSFTCTLSGNTMTLIMEGRTFKLTKK